MKTKLELYKEVIDELLEEQIWTINLYIAYIFMISKDYWKRIKKFIGIDEKV